MPEKKQLEAIYVGEEAKDRFWNFPIGGKFATDRLNNILDELERRRDDAGD